MRRKKKDDEILNLCYNEKITFTQVAHTILIIGGGFAGTESALALARQKMPKTKIRLLEPKTYFEYHAALYRFATGRSPMESCIPYTDIFKGYDVDIVRDTALCIDLEANRVEGLSGSHYHFDTLLIALGSAGTTFGIEGVSRYSFGMKTAAEALRLKMHIEESFMQASLKVIEERAPLLSVVVVGGGACGVEIAGELASFTRMLSSKHRMLTSIPQIHLIEATGRLLGTMPEDASRIAERRLQLLGVRIRLNTNVTKEEENILYVGKEKLESSTVIWTAGISGHSLVKATKGLELDPKGRIVVDEYLRAKGRTNIYALGDNASTLQSGMAQTALHDGRYVAEVLAAKSDGQKPKCYVAHSVVYAVPVGPTWAIVVWKTWVISGRTGWIVRRLLDLWVFIRLLPIRKALRTFLCGYKMQEEM